MNYTSSNSFEPKPIDLKQLASLKEKLAQVKVEQKWTLIDPSGKVWIEADPMNLVSVLCQHMVLLRAPRSKE
jgi:hypothetical protein